MSKDYVVMTGKVEEIMKNAIDEDGQMTDEAANQARAELAKLGINVIGQRGQSSAGQPVTDEHGRTFFEVSIHPFAEQYANWRGQPVQGDWFNTSGSDLSDVFGDEPEDYPPSMFRTGWSVTSWVRVGDDDDHMDEVDDEEFSDFETANAFAEMLAEKYNVPIDHRY